VILESPLALKTALSDSSESSNNSGKIKFMRDYTSDGQRQGKMKNLSDIPPTPVDYSVTEFQ
jgi:hypothetical protein